MVRSAEMNLPANFVCAGERSRGGNSASPLICFRCSPGADAGSGGESGNDTQKSESLTLRTDQS
jgi:hypothetical protein